MQRSPGTSRAKGTPCGTANIPLGTRVQAHHRPTKPSPAGLFAPQAPGRVLQAYPHNENCIMIYVSMYEEENIRASHKSQPSFGRPKETRRVTNPEIGETTLSKYHYRCINICMVRNISSWGGHVYIRETMFGEKNFLQLPALAIFEAFKRMSNLRCRTFEGRTQVC